MKNLALLFVLVAACTSSGSGDILTATVHRTGGLAPTPASGSSCQAIDDTYTYDAATLVVTWQRCEEQGTTGVFQLVPGQQAIATSTAQQLEAALSDLHASAQQCGGDIRDRIVITSTNGSTTFDPAQCAGDSAVFEILDGLNAF